MELDVKTEDTLCTIMNVNKNNKEQPNVELVKKEAPETDDIPLESLLHQVPTIKQEIVFDEKFKFSSPQTSELKVASTKLLERKSEMLDQDYDIERDKNISIKNELLHEELVIKSEDEAISDSLLDNKYNSVTQLQKHNTIPCEIKPFKCNMCNYSCVRKTYLNRHLRLHTGEKPFKCNVCDYSCTQNCYLKIHLRTHTGEKPFKCNICDRSFRLTGTLKGHLRTHTGEKLFECSICDYSTARSSTFEIHLRAHKPLKCNICDYSCTLNTSLIAHSRTHTGDKPFKCDM